MDAGLDISLQEQPAYVIAPLYPDHQKMIDVSRSLGARYHPEAGFYMKALSVLSCELDSTFRPAFQKAQGPFEDYGLKLIQPAVPADISVIKMRQVRTAMVGELAYPLGKLGIRGNDRSCVTKGAQVLARVKTEASRDSE